MQNIKYLGVGEFGEIYEGLKGAEAEDFMLKNKSGEIRNAFYYKSIGSIDLFWGNENVGYAKIVRKHPEVLGKIQEILDQCDVISISPNRVKLSSKQFDASVSLNWYGKDKKWILTAYDKTLTITK